VLATDKAVEVTQYYPQENTFGATFGYAYDALVTRFITFYEPKRVLRNQAADNPFDGDRVYDQRMVGGVGFDWVFNNHLKFYSEQYVTRLETVVPGDATAEEEAVSGVIDEYVASFRVTNETFENILMSFEAVITAPERSRALIPKVEWTFADNYKIAGGARLFSSSHTDSRFESLKHSSYYFVRLESNFDAGQILR
jgi:hypothetical protein